MYQFVLHDLLQGRTGLSLEAMIFNWYLLNLRNTLMSRESSIIIHKKRLQALKLIQSKQCSRSILNVSYIRCIAVHPTQPFILTGSDDMTVKLWNWDREWKCVRVFEGHSHYVMSLAINPKDPNTFASSCLDRTVKIWSFGSSGANYTLDAHDKGVMLVINHILSLQEMTE